MDVCDVTQSTRVGEYRAIAKNEGVRAPVQRAQPRDSEVDVVAR
jgi:hypothetical protein